MPQYAAKVFSRICGSRFHKNHLWLTSLCYKYKRLGLFPVFVQALALAPNPTFDRHPAQRVVQKYTISLDMGF